MQKRCSTQQIVPRQKRVIPMQNATDERYFANNNEGLEKVRSSIVGLANFFTYCLSLLESQPASRLYSES